jgi:hypothetical protein
MDGSVAIAALDRNDGTHQDAVDCSVLTRTEFDEVTDAGSSAAPHMTWVIDGDTVHWFVIGSDGWMIWI